MADSYALTVEQLGLLAEKTLVNSREMLNEAKALGMLDRFPRAFALAILSAEEFGKHLMCFGAVGLRSDDTDGWKEFHKRFRSHDEKYTNALSMAVSKLPEEEQAAMIENLEKHVFADQQRKFAGFCVDLVDGEAVHPAEVISQEAVSGAVIVLDQVLSNWEHLYEDAFFEDVFAAGIEAGAEQLLYALKDDDEETIRQFLDPIRDAE